MIGILDISMIYLSPDPYHEAFEEEVDIWRFDLNKHRTAGLCLAHHDGCLFLGGIAKSTPCVKIPRWRSRIKGAWLIKIRPYTVTTIQEHRMLLLPFLLLVLLMFISSSRTLL
jgi:hypothetical protein